VNAITEFIKAMGAARLAAMGAVAVGLIGFFIYLMMQFNTPQMTVLYSDLEFDDSIAIVKKLEGMNVLHKVRQEGAIILVPRERVLRLRMQMAEEGLPSGGMVGYEIFDKSGALGTTRFVQDINKLRALEGELARTIRALSRVKRARVHLVLPKKKIFSREVVKPSASIIIKTRGTLDKSQVRAIQHLVASAIEGLKPGRVSIVDDKGELLANGNGDGGGNGLLAGKADERTYGFERQLQAKINEIVGSVVGAERTRVRVTAELDYNQITKTSDLFDPDGRVVRSTQTREESRNSTRAGANKGVSVGNELPNAGANNGGEGDKEKDASRKTEEIVNYEISHTHKTEVLAGGRIKRLSVAVLVDGVYTNGADGKPVYNARTQQELDKITTLVKSAMGFDKTRGDQLHVVNLRFANNGVGAELPEEEAGFFDLAKADYFHIAELAVIFIISTLVLLLVVRPLVKRIITPEVEEDELIGVNGENMRMIPGPDGQLVAVDGNTPLALEDQQNEAARSIEAAKAAGELQASAVKEVGALIQNNPNEAISVVRNWMNADQQAKEEAA